MILINIIIIFSNNLTKSVMNEIKLVQKPIIEHQLALVGESIGKRLAELNLDNLVATSDTVQALKTTRAELNKDHKSFNEQLKEALEPITSPVAEIKELFKVNVTDKYKPADSLLKDKIGSVEIKVKEEKEANVLAYFNELCIAEEIGFLEFKNVGLEINLSTSEKKYKEQCNIFVTKVKDDLDLIATQEFQTEILVEYKKTLNASKAIKEIKERKESERLEAERIKLHEQDRRKNKLLSIAVVYHSTTKVYAFNDEIYVSEDKVSKASKEEFASIVLRLEGQIKAFNKAKEEAAKPKIETKQEPAQQEIKAPVQTPKPAEAIKAPIEEKKEVVEILTTSFEVSGTLTQLKALKAYMQENNLIFKTI